ncbi:hypothetical protein [Mariprofundus ferrooxydans]|uniref:hypothetical protein n=1 Tax=Mariprofundus ferrooxydans TaxID=314344 RepID=UPI0012DC4AC6|nr:hypothetical protein [Mariprofundus ferrooxydans]
MTPLIIANNGVNISYTNYFDIEQGKAVYVYLSCNAGAIRLLLPDLQMNLLNKIQSTEHVVISRGAYPSIGKHDFIEIMFEDYTGSPYAIHTEVSQCDFLPANRDSGREFEFSIWTASGKQRTLPCFLRLVKKLPCLKPFPIHKRKKHYTDNI